MLEVGKYYLFACPWDWTFVGRFRGIQAGRVVIDHAIYFTFTGSTFGPLCRSGLTPESQYSACGDNIGIGDLADIKTWPWHAPVTWVNPDDRA
jgi:hypothetical protein